MRKLIWFSVCFCLASCGGPATKQQTAGNARRGAELFQQMKCVTCHSVRGAGGTIGPALGAQPGVHDSPNAVAAAMWSHAIKMWEEMEKAGLSRPKISQQDAADLVAHIAGTVRPDPAGDVARGRKAYEDKLCASCHDQYSGAPDFHSLGGNVSPYWMISGLWEHGAGMLSQITAKNASWQHLSAQDVGDILSYLNSRK